MFATLTDILHPPSPLTLYLGVCVCTSFTFYLFVCFLIFFCKFCLQTRPILGILRYVYLQSCVLVFIIFVLLLSYEISIFDLSFEFSLGANGTLQAFIRIYWV